jgi:hypothetical protein
MNERIRDLVRESNLDVYGLGKERYKWEYTVEKFTELIVRDCIGIAHGSDMPAKDIKEHFGIKE